MAGRPRKPANVLKFTGADKVNPGRLKERIENEPKDDRALGDPPEHLSALEQVVWHELADNAIPGVLCQADRHAVESTCKLLARLRAQGAEDCRRRDLVAEAIDQVEDDEINYALRLLFRYVTAPPLFNTSDQSNLTTLLRQMGMAPADRSKISLPKKPKGNKFDDD